MVWPGFTPLFNLSEKISQYRTSEEEIPEFTYSQPPPTDSTDKLTLPGTTGGIWEAFPPNLLINNSFIATKLPSLGKTSSQKGNQNWYEEKQRPLFPL